jgi:hypothetical protein
MATRASSKHRRGETEAIDLNKSLESFILEFESKDKPTTKDIMAAIVTMMKHVVDVNKQNLKLIQSQEEFEDKMFNFIEKAEACETKVNQLEQKEVNGDLYLSNFPEKPDVTTVCDNLSKTLQLSRESIKGAYSFALMRKPPPQSSPKNSAQTYSVVVKLVDENAKIEFLKKKKDLGVIKLEQLIPTIAAKFKDISIPCLSRLTKFNNSLVSILIKARADKKIESFQMRNGLFRFKQTGNVNWSSIGTEYDRQEFTSKILGISPPDNEEQLSEAE